MLLPGRNEHAGVFPCQITGLTNPAAVSFFRSVLPCTTSNLASVLTDRRQGVLQGGVRHLRGRRSFRPRHAHHGEQGRPGSVFRRRGRRRRRRHRRVQLPKRVDNGLGRWQRRGCREHSESHGSGSRLSRRAQKLKKTAGSLGAFRRCQLRAPVLMVAFRTGEA